MWIFLNGTPISTSIFSALLVLFVSIDWILNYSGSVILSFGSSLQYLYKHPDVFE